VSAGRVVIDRHGISPDTRSVESEGRRDFSTDSKLARRGCPVLPFRRA
jgi:hypothetical protein